MYEGLTPEYIKAEMLGGFKLADTREGSYTNSLVSPVAYEMWKAYTALAAVMPMVYIDETSGPYIDMKAGQYGIARKPGARAKAAVAFTGDSGTVVPAGKVFLTADSLQYTLDKAVTIADGVAQGALTAAEIGGAYNVPAGAISRQVNNLAGIASVMSGPAEGGADAESDASLVARYYAYLRRPPTSGNAAHYEFWALEVDGVGAAKVMPLWAGPGTVKVLIVDYHDRPVDPAVAADCAAHIEAERPIGPEVTVVSAAGRPVSATAEVVIKPSTDMATVGAEFREALGAYLEGIAFKEYTVVYNRIGYILLGLPSVVDFAQLLVNGGTADICLGADEVPVMGAVEVSAHG